MSAMEGVEKRVVSASVYCVFVLLVLCPLLEYCPVSGSDDVTGCGRVAEYYGKHVGRPFDVPSAPVADAGLGVCGHSLQFSGYKSCCTPAMEQHFLEASVIYLQDHVQMNNAKVKAGITHTLDLYLDHIQASLMVSRQKMTSTLQKLYRIPKATFGKTLDIFLSGLAGNIKGENLSLEGVLEDFFGALFPQVYEHLLSDPQRVSSEFRQCLQDRTLHPFGPATRAMLKSMRNAMDRARLFTETLRVLLGVVEMADGVSMDPHCKRAVTRLQYCSLCGQVTEVRPCRGLCLNVMRGCMAYVRDLSPAWDDLVSQFQELHKGMYDRRTAADVIYRLDGDLRDAVWGVMEDLPRIYGQVRAKCQATSNHTAEAKHFSTPEGRSSSVPSSARSPGHRLQAIRADIARLVGQLQDSQGFLQRVADDLCRHEMLYDSRMDSGQCWNGSAVGRYMHDVPEANTISQATSNIEVKVTLSGNKQVQEHKNSMDTVRRRLKALLDEESMQQDEGFELEPSVREASYGRQVELSVNDDEDYSLAESGSGSGDGLDGGGGDPTDTQTSTGSRAGSAGSCTGGNCAGAGTGSSHGRGRDTSDGGNGAPRPLTSSWFVGAAILVGLFARCWL